MSPGPACVEYWKTDIVFVGVVDSIYRPEIAEGEDWAPAAIARFTVEEAFRGVKVKQIEVAGSIRRTGIGFSSDGMGFNFDVGKRYLVYANRSKTDRWIWSNVCTRTQLLSEADDDLKYIRGLRLAKPGGSILGMVRRRGEWIADDNEGPVSGVKITARSGKALFEAVSDRDGAYRFDGLKLGNYKITFLVPQNFASLLEGNRNYFDVSVLQDRGCVEADITIAVDGGVTGTVTDTDGRPVPGVNVEIVAVEPPGEDENSKSWVNKSDEEGRYELRHVPPGRYHLGINIAGGHWGVGYETSFYPGVTEIERAQVIAIAEGQRLRGLDFRVPAVTEKRTIRGVALTSDMKPISRAFIALQSSLDARPRWDLAVTTDDQGWFSIKEHDSYIVSVHGCATGLDGKPKSGGPVILEKRIGEITPFQFFITGPGPSCSVLRSQK